MLYKGRRRAPRRCEQTDLICNACSYKKAIGESALSSDRPISYQLRVTRFDSVARTNKYRHSGAGQNLPWKIPLTLTPHFQDCLAIHCFFLLEALLWDST